MISEDVVRRCLEVAFLEDSPLGDLTGDNLFPSDHRSEAVLRTRQSGVFCGVDVVRLAFLFYDSGAHVNLAVDDGDSIVEGQILAEVNGSSRSLLRAERIALNFVQRLSGIATITRSFVDAVSHTNAKIVDTRKTTPGLRALERYAVRCGGGTNHRFSLSDAILVKDNHLAFINQQGRDVTKELKSLKDRVSFTAHIEVEVDKLEQIEPVLASGVVDSLLIDNFSLAQTVEAVHLVKQRALINASGGISTPEQARQIAEAGVDLLSVGALTHSASVIDIGFDAIETE